ncbi:unnamed protein product [Phaedon cochleariae]|uniref:UV radiation resistance-associated gene protein n=1 Tax=Phaedon cochleariae TaxID=80249 RepID=A0A9P0DM35_PHACE|nr:unnamed protein product [Phaedon cochleariae]
MSSSAEEFMLGRQRCRQWVPLITQQFRLRHVYQIVGLNLPAEPIGSFYFTLHSTTMSAPFYTSEQVSGSNPKWEELNLQDMPNTSASCVVLRIWQHSTDGADVIVLTWGVNFSGLCYIGNKTTDIQPVYFKGNSVIFCMQGGFYTSHEVVNMDSKKPIPFLSNLNLIDTSNGNKVIYRRIAIKSNRHEVQSSYNEGKLRRLHRLQVDIRNKSLEVGNLRDKISRLNGFSIQRDGSTVESSSSTIRYAPQLLTMNSLYKMMQEKPTIVQKQEMTRIGKEIETAKFRTRLLSQEKDKKTVIIRSLRQNHTAMVEENEERNSDLMENYHKLSRGSEKLKEYKKNLFHHRELYSNFNSQLQQRRKKLLRELLFIYPIDKMENDRYSIFKIYLPNSDILADCSDTGLAVALGYVAHILIMCSTFLQVPLRYSVTHYGSRSVITDHVSPLLPDKDRDFPLFTKGKDKAHFTYAVYLLNKNLAQFRWLLYMNTTDLRQTLYNLLTFLEGPRETSSAASDRPKGGSERDARLHDFSSVSNLSDPILDFIRQECQQQKQHSPSKKSASSGKSRSSECGRGLGEILAIPEAYLNRRISSDSFRSFMSRGLRHEGSESCCGSSTPPISSQDSLASQIKITNGKEIVRDSDGAKPHNVEQGTDPLNGPTKLSAIISKSVAIHSDGQLRMKVKEGDENGKDDRRISRSVGSYSDEENGFSLAASFEVGSEPALTVDGRCDSRKKEEDSSRLPQSMGEGQFLERWLENTPMCSNEDMYPEEVLGTSSEREKVLLARADALRSTKSFNLMRPKP